MNEGFGGPPNPAGRRPALPIPSESKNCCPIPLTTGHYLQMPDANDMELVREHARQNSEPAFAELVRRHISMVYSVAMRFTGNPGDAEDVTQAVFILLARKAAGLSDRTVLTGWLYETTRLTAAGFLRSQNRRRHWEQEACMEPDLNQPETGNLWRQLAPHLEAAMSRLAERDRTLLALRFYENKTGAEAAALLGIREDAAHKRTARALDKLRQFFSKRGVDSTTAEVIAKEISTNSIQIAPVALAKTVTAVAVVKGATASASTLTLIKGALKIMAWIKIKTAIVVGVGLLLAGGTTTLVTAAFDKTSSPASPDPIYEKLWASVGQFNPDEVASISSTLKKAPPILIVRPTHYPGSGGGIVKVDGDKGCIANAPVSALIQFAFDYPPIRTVLPDLLSKERFDLMATLPDGHNAAALKEEIKRQFGLVAHAEIRQTDTLLLMVKNSGKLQARLSKDDKGAPHLVEVANILERAFDIPILDRSGLTNRYALNLHFQAPARNNKLEAERTRQSVRDQLDQFGLELVPSREPVELLVVENAR
jgi:uncharacterized protein (TIGR03435 family)